MKTFEVQFRYRDRNEETAESMVKVEASSLQARSVSNTGVCQRLGPEAEIRYEQEWSRNYGQAYQRDNGDRSNQAGRRSLRDY